MFKVTILDSPEPGLPFAIVTPEAALLALAKNEKAIKTESTP